MKTRLCSPGSTVSQRLFVSQRSSAESGSALIVGLVTLTVLALIAASTFLTVSNRFRSNYQTASWHDALTSAENGVQYGLIRLRSPLTKTDPSIQGNSTSNTFLNQVLTNPLQVPGSLQADLSNSALTTSNNGSVSSFTYGSKNYPQIQLPTLTLPHDGQGSTIFSAVVSVSAVPNTGGDNGATTYYRIRSTGTVPLAGGSKVGIQKYDNFLRKLQFTRDSSGNVLTTPQAVRTIEIVAKPISIGSAALFGKTGINLNNQNVIIDSYDSRDPNSSKNGTYTNGVYSNGVYDSKHATQSANVVTNDATTSKGDPGVINLSPTGAYVNGNVATNDVPVQGSTGHVSGTVTEDFYQNLPNPPDPSTMSVTWTSFPTSSGAVTIDTTAGTLQSPLRYKVDGNGNGGTSISLQNDNLNITGKGYVEVWIPGDLSVNGNAEINIPDGAHVTFYVDGKVDITGNGVLNSSTIPSYLTFYGNPDPKSSQSISIAGNADFAGIIYAPNSDVAAKGGGNSGAIYGAIIANTIFFNGGTTLHYDVALGDLGAVIDYRIASWYEDNTLTK